MIIQRLPAAAVILAALILAPTDGAGPEMFRASGTPQASAALIAHSSPDRTGHGIISPATSITDRPDTASHPSSVPPRPHFVAGYTPHALQRMAQRGITRVEVEMLVASPNPGIYQDDNDTWLIMDPHTTLTVIINKNAWIVTGIKGQM